MIHSAYEYKVRLGGSEKYDLRQVKKHRYRNVRLVICILIVLLANDGKLVAETTKSLDCCEQTVLNQCTGFLACRAEGIVVGQVDLPRTGRSMILLDHHLYLPSISSQRPLAHGPSKLGLHTLFPNNATEFVRGVHDAGAHVALVKAVDNFGYLRDVKEISPETVTVARWDGRRAVDPSGDPAEKAADMLCGDEGHMERWKYEKDVVDYWEILNENDPPSIEGHVWLAQFFIAAMDIAEANGYKLALFSYSTGVPQWHEWEAIVETGVFARAKAGGHVLALHEYNWPVTDYRWGEATEDQPPYEDRGVLTGRYRYLYRDFLIPRDEVIPLLITESGLDPVLGGPPGEGPWQERYVEEMIWYDTKLREDDYVVGATMFTIGPTSQWTYYDYEELLPDFHDYIVSLKDA